jgi:methyltransferase-like protein/2-polyprenyl-3-methyl-5-hydroxy-6-metoxy-1,4-benzoquinol methylase
MDASSYDQIPYTSLAFPQTHPDHLASIARLFALSPPDVSASRVLELGCASGGNIVPMAWNLPRSEFVGIDLSQQQVADGCATIAALGLRNIRIEHASIADVDEGWGQFDYIICHGVFSWVERDVQDTILAIVARTLSANGIAYVSYNTYPGWHAREMVRQMMRYHAAQFSEVGAQVAQARALLSFLASATKDTGPYHDVLAREAERLSRSPDSYVFHEHLERTNIPLYFHEFVARAESAGLQYLSESIVSEMLTSTFSPDVARTLQRISPDLLHLEQYMDFVRNRQFRQTLLCHANLSPQRALTPEALSGLLLSSAAVADNSVDLTSGVPVTFSSGTRRARVTSPGSKAALHLLMERWPCGVAADDLFEMALQRAAPYLDVASAGDMEAAMTEDLFGAVMHGLIDVRTQPPPCTNQPSNTPRAHPLAAFQAERGPLVVNAHHAMHDLDPLTRDVLTLSNGQRTRDEMVQTLGNRLDAGRATLDAAITALTRRALFVG